MGITSPQLEQAQLGFNALSALARRLDCGVALLHSDMQVRWSNEPLRNGAATSAHELICGRECGEGDCPILESLQGACAVEIVLEPGNVRRRIAAAPWPEEDGAVLVQYADTKRGLGMQALRTSVERYRALVENMAEGLCIIDAAEHFVMVNPAAERTFGVPPGGLEGRNLSEFLLPQDYDEILRQTAVRQAGQTSVYDAQIRRPDGDVRWLQLTASPRFDDNGVYLGAFTLFQDITERRQMEEALRESERNFRQLYDNSPVMLQSIDEHGFLRNVNRKWLETMGYSRDEVIGQRLDTFLSPELASYVMQQVIPRFWRQGYLDGEHGQYVRQDGSLIDVEASSVAMRDPQGRRVSLSVLQDITARRKTEEQLLRLYTAIEQANECVVVTDTDGRVQYINSAFEDLSGYARADALDEHGVFRVPSLHTLAFEAARSAGLSGPWEGVVTAQKRDGSPLDVEATIAPVHSKAGELTNYVCTYRDVSRERSLQAQLVQAQKMEAVGQMAGGIAHEFNNLLTAIIGNLSLAELEGPQHPDYEAYLRDAAEAAQRSGDITRQLLLFSRKTAGTFEPVSLGEIARSVAKLARHSFPAGLELSLELDGHCEAVQGDATMLHQVLMNLVFNARDASPRGGRVTLHGTCIDIEPGSTDALPPARAGRFAVLEVRDTGEGMDSATAARIFEPFFTTKPAGQGTGLGLAVVYSIVQQHGGWITVESQPGLGTTFRVHLPAAETPAGEAPVAAPVSDGIGETVLIVEDDALVLPMLRGTLRSHGYQVLTARNGEEALRLAERQRIDLAVLDMQLPGMSGSATLLKLRETQPGLRALFVSGNASPEEVAAVTGDSALLSKPFRANELLSAVHAALSVAQDTRGD